ncbi:hypothetical protein TgHK011_007445 [Trichoderma gracile]|nr:hypothetical protein TgHK011_007445 [Trichoderma gracile]
MQRGFAGRELPTLQQTPGRGQATGSCKIRGWKRVDSEELRRKKVPGQSDEGDALEIADAAEAEEVEESGQNGQPRWYKYVILITSVRIGGPRCPLLSSSPAPGTLLRLELLLVIP